MCPALRADRPRFAPHMSSCTHGSIAGPSRLARRAAGSITLRVAMSDRRFAPSATAPSAFISPARRLGRWPLTPPDAPRPVGIPSASLCRYEHCVLFLSQHVCPALRADRPRFAPHMSSCTHGSIAGPSRLARRAAGSITLRVAMSDRRFAPSATAPSAFISPARRLGRWPLTPPDAPRPVGIPSASLCRYEHCVLSPPQLAAGDTSLRRWSALV